MANNEGMIKIALFGGAAYLAYRQGWLSFLGLGTPAPAGTTPTVTSPLVYTPPAETTGKTPAPSTSTGTPSFNSLDAIYSRMIALSGKDGITSTNADVWNAYAVAAGAPNPMPAPEDAGLTRSNITSAQYWTAVSPLLKSQRGLSGLGVYGGLGQLAMRYR